MLNFVKELLVCCITEFLKGWDVCWQNPHFLLRRRNASIRCLSRNRIITRLELRPKFCMSPQSINKRNWRLGTAISRQQHVKQRPSRVTDTFNVSSSFGVPWLDTARVNDKPRCRSARRRLSHSWLSRLQRRGRTALGSRASQVNAVVLSFASCQYRVKQTALCSVAVNRVVWP